MRKPAPSAEQLAARIAGLLERDGSAYATRIALRMRNCGRWRLALLRDNEDGTAHGRSLPIGCRCRLCPSCSAARRGKLDRKYRPQIQALMERGHPVLFVTLTRAPVPGQDVRPAFDAMRAAWVAMRYGRKARDWWNARVCGGLYGLEATLYERHLKGPRKGEIRNDPQTGELKRRVHAHIHAVLVLPLGADPAAVTQDLRTRWLQECDARGWRAVAKAQDLQVVQSAELDDEKNPARYVVKYISKPSDLLDSLDAVEMLRGCKGMRQVQTLGILHGNALRSTQAAADAAELDADAAALHQAEAAEFVAELEADAARTVEDEDGDAAAHPHRVAERAQRRVAVVARKDAAVLRAHAFKPLAGPAWRDRTAPRVRARQERAAKARERVAKKAAWAAETGRRLLAHVDEGPPSEMQWRRILRHARAEAAHERACTWAQRCAGWAARPVRLDDDGRSFVLAERASRAAEASRWRVVQRDDCEPEIAAATHDDEVHEAQVYAGSGHVLREASELVARRRAAAERARADFDAVARLYHESCGSYGDELQQAGEALAAKDEDTREAERALRGFLRRMPLPLVALQRAVELGSGTAEHLAAIVAAGDAQREERAAERAEKIATATKARRAHDAGRGRSRRRANLQPQPNRQVSLGLPVARRRPARRMQAAAQR